MLAIRAVPTFVLAMVALMLATWAHPGARATPLHLAAYENPDPAAIAALIEAGADVNARIGGGATPLHGAALNNPELAVIAALIKGGANVNAQMLSDYTPLHAAAKEPRNPAVIEALLEAGADPRRVSKPASSLGSGKTPFDYAKDNKALRGTEVYWRLNETRFK